MNKELEGAIIRPMTKEDVKNCIEMTLESFGDDYVSEQFVTTEEEFNAAFGKEWWGRPKYFVCEFNDQIIGMGGYSLSWLDWDTFELFWLSIRKEFKGKGIGKILTEHLESEAIKDGKFKKDITILFSCTKTVVEYHKRHGYKVVIEKAAGEEIIMGKTFLKNN